MRGKLPVIALAAQMILLLPGEGYADERFVSPSGSDARGNGSIDHPFSTIAHAFGVSTPGDVVLLRGGTYRIASVQRLAGPGGSDGKSIRIEPYRDEVPVLDASDMPASLGDKPEGVALSISASYIVLQGLRVENAAGGGIVITGSGNILQDVVVASNGRASTWDGTGVRVEGSAANNLFLRVDSYLNQDRLGAGDDADGFSFHSTGSGNVFRFCRAWLNSDDGFDFFNATDNSKQGSARVAYSLAWLNGYDADGKTPLGDGRGFKMGGQRTPEQGNTTGVSGGHMFIGNFAWDNKGVGFDENGAKIPLWIEGNRAFGNRIADVDIPGDFVRSTARHNRAGRALLGNVESSENRWRVEPAERAGPERRQKGSLPAGSNGSASAQRSRTALYSFDRRSLAFLLWKRFIHHH
jgi:hypothetical protein